MKLETTPSVAAHLTDFANLVTLGNLVLGTGAAMLLLVDHDILAVLALIWAVFLDHLDGYLARMSSDAQSYKRAFGCELDNLADLISFSVVPGMFAFVLGGMDGIAAAVGLFLPVCGALRLAYFNLYGLRNRRFVGVPATYCAALFAIVPVYLLHQLLHAPRWTILSIGVVLGAVQVLPISMPKLRLPILTLFGCAVSLSVLIVVTVGSIK